MPSGAGFQIKLVRAGERRGGHGSSPVQSAWCVHSNLSARTHAGAGSRPGIAISDSEEEEEEQEEEDGEGEATPVEAREGLAAAAGTPEPQLLTLTSLAGSAGKLQS